ncbi:RidA family protein [Ferruginibacter sp. SUN106]|uniref:RidA family protein n=1 Tax=Ferruginibacter sp. SUN106 TaxID=2978348 RepID=UPI003D3601D7
MKRIFSLALLLCSASLSFMSCNTADTTTTATTAKPPVAEAPEYFNLRPKLEKEYGYTHAVKIGDDLKISGAVSMTDSGTIIGVGDMELQMKNCYVDLQKILQHYGYTIDDVVAENIYTTNMDEFIKVSGYRNTIYKKQFPTGTWLEVKGLALHNQLIEIDMEAHKVK